jgi:FtsH-binding integral membrane protein
MSSLLSCFKQEQPPFRLKRIYIIYGLDVSFSFIYYPNIYSSHFSFFFNLCFAHMVSCFSMAFHTQKHAFCGSSTIDWCECNKMYLATLIVYFVSISTLISKIMINTFIKTLCKNLWLFHWVHFCKWDVLIKYENI